MSAILTVGRPTVRTQERREQILALLRMGLSRHGAAAKAGIGRTSLYDWLNDEPEFSNSVCLAEDEAQANFEMVLAKAAAEGNVSVALEVLKRRRPREWGDRQTIDVDEQIEKLLVELAGLRDTNDR